MRLNEKRTAPLRIVLSVVTLSCWVLSAHAQSTSGAAPTGVASLKEVFETAWQRQPEARALQSRRDAAQAQAKAAGLLSPEAPSVEISQRSDRATGNNGAREAEIGIAVPLWLPGQRTASADLAQAEISFVERRLLASQPFGERYGQTLLIGIRVPFGAGPRYDARVATAQAEAIEVQSQLILERDRIQADQRGAASRVEAARIQLDAAQRRAKLARESRGFFDKSFRLGETDLPTRLRIEAEAVEAERQEARSRIDLATAISAWRQSLGLLPQ